MRIIYERHTSKAQQCRCRSNLFDILINGEIFQITTQGFRTLEFGSKSICIATLEISFNQSAQPLYHKNFELISGALKDYQTQGYHLYISSDSVKQTDRIASIFEDRGDDIKFTPILHTIHEGFIDHDLSLCSFTDHQIFDRFHKVSLRSDVARSGKVALTLKELNQFQIGDYVVHIDHGIGRFGGLIVTNNDGRRQEVIKTNLQNEYVIFCLNPRSASYLEI